VESGYKVIKLKIGGIDFDDEIRILSALRDRFHDRIIIRLDANGGFSNEDAISKLNQLAKFDIHSIEQPIRAGQWNEMKSLCSKSPIPIALDEELIGIEDTQLKLELIKMIRPQFIVLKPTLHGGFSGCDEWIEIAESEGLNWWATSALESNIGLNAIAQWLTTKNVQLEQGLGTGSLYLNNLSPAWVVNNGYLEFDGLDSLSHDISKLR
jgi:L-alanine-DL-glutamate epimerase-like enolase superfamily enzyme